MLEIKEKHYRSELDFKNDGHMSIIQEYKEKRRQIKNGQSLSIYDSPAGRRSSK